MFNELLMVLLTKFNCVVSSDDIECKLVVSFIFSYPMIRDCRKVSYHVAS